MSTFACCVVLQASSGLLEGFHATIGHHAGDKVGNPQPRDPLYVYCIGSTRAECSSGPVRAAQLIFRGYSQVRNLHADSC
jgi:hypothetical protein